MGPLGEALLKEADRIAHALREMPEDYLQSQIAMYTREIARAEGNKMPQIMASMEEARTILQLALQWGNQARERLRTDEERGSLAALAAVEMIRGKGGR